MIMYVLSLPLFSLVSDASELHVQQNKELSLFTNVTTDRKRLISVFLQLLELEWNDSAREQFKIFVVFNYKITIITWSVVQGD